MADTTRPRLTSLTVKELLDITDKASTLLSELMDVYAGGSGGSPQVRAFLLHRHGDTIRDLREIAMLAQDVIGSSGQGCAADEVILELQDDDGGAR